MKISVSSWVRWGPAAYLFIIGTAVGFTVGFAIGAVGAGMAYLTMVPVVIPIGASVILWLFSRRVCIG